MAPSIPLVAALFRIADASLDEQSMLQMPMLEQSIATEEGNSDCRCPGYFREQCEQNEFQGCRWTSEDLGQHRLGWTDRGNSNEPWCQCDPDYAPPGGGPVHPVVPQPVPVVPQPVPVVPQPAPTLPPPPPVPAQAPAAECPAGWEQKGDIGADIGGCGLQSCAERYDITSEAACAARCDGNSACVGFSYAPMNGDRNHAGVTACTIYNSDTPTGTWTGTEGIPTQVFCGRAYSDVQCAGRTAAGATSWVQYSADGIYLDVDTSQCGFQGVPVYFSSLGGSSHHWMTTGSSEIYEATATGFRVYINQASITPSQANDWDWHVNWIADGIGSETSAAVNQIGDDHGVCSGQTASGATNWVQYSADGIYLDVDTSQCGFQGMPVYISSLGGSSHHWMTTGSSEIYHVTATGFRVYVNQASITPSQANGWGWHVNWIGKGLEGQSEASAPCTGLTVSGSTNWVTYSANGIYIDVDTSACGFPVVPVYVTSVGGDSSHWESKGSSEIYSPTTTGFRMYIYKTGITPSQANSWGWNVNWMGSVEA